MEHPIGKFAPAADGHQAEAARQLVVVEVVEALELVVLALVLGAARQEAQVF